MIKQLIKFLKILNGDIAPGQIAAGLAFALFFAFTPLFSLHNVLILFLVCIFRVNITAVLIGMAVFSLLTWFIDPYFIALGHYLLTSPDLLDMWTAMYQQDIWRLAHFNNTLTLGSFVVSVVLWLPVFFLSRFLVLRYRSQFMAYVNKLRIVKWLKGSRYFSVALNAMGDNV